MKLSKKILRVIIISSLMFQSCNDDGDEVTPDSKDYFTIRAGGTGYDDATSITDAQGNTYIAGRFDPSITFGTTTLSGEGT
jgi:hypothetical protein